VRELNEEPCPVADSVLGQLYRANPHGLAELIETISPDVRAMLAVYCYRRAHLASIGLAVAASCEEDDLTWHGGNLGTDLFKKCRAPEAVEMESFHSQRRKVSLSKGTIRQLAPLDDGEDRPQVRPAQGAFLKVVAQDLI
jgi:hypothetical protein